MHMLSSWAAGEFGRSAALSIVSISQVISELSAIDAPMRPLVVPLFITYSVLVIAFGLGVWGSARQKRALRVVGGLLGYRASHCTRPLKRGQKLFCL